MIQSFRKGVIPETETTLWERSSSEELPWEGRRSPGNSNRKTSLRTYRRKLPLPVASKRRASNPIDDMAFAAVSTESSQGTSLAQEYVKEKLTQAVEQRYLEGRNNRLTREVRGRSSARDSFRAPPLFNSDLTGPWYGNYVGPDDPLRRADSDDAPSPRTPIDRAAMQHDLDYYAAQRGYDFQSTDPAMVWLEAFYSLDPKLQSGLGAADAKLAVRAPLYFIQGIFDGTYGLDDFSSDERHKAFASDFTWAVAITSTHVVLATHRFGMATLGLILEGGQAITHGLINLGKSVGGVGGFLISGIGYIADAVLVAAVETARFLWSLGTSIVGVGVAITNLLLSPITYALAYIGAKVISGIVTVGKVIWEGIKSIGEAIGDFFDSIFMLTEAARLSFGAGVDVRMTMCQFRDRYVRHEDSDGKFLSDYYDVAPLIVAEVERLPNSIAIWSRAYDEWVLPCVECARRGDDAEAFDYLCDMLDNLAMQTGLRPGEDRFVRHWKQSRVTT